MAILNAQARAEFIANKLPWRAVKKLKGTGKEAANGGYPNRHMARVTTTLKHSKTVCLQCKAQNLRKICRDKRLVVPANFAMYTFTTEY